MSLEPQAEENATLANANLVRSLASNCTPGTRFPSYQVVAQSDARPWQLHHKMPSDGRFRLIVFSGDITSPSRIQLINELGVWLASTLLLRYRTIALSPGSDAHGMGTKFKTHRDPSIIDVLLLHSGERVDVEILRDLHEVYHPFDEKLGWNYDKVFVDCESYHDGHGHAYEGYGVDAGTGAIVIVRPDGYVGLVTGLEEKTWRDIEAWFDGVLRKA
jgi:phenol 2-monooxygenase (NADPH)